MARWRKQVARVGIAIGPRGIHAAELRGRGSHPGAREVWARSLSVPLAPGADRSDLDDAMAELRARLDGRPFQARVVLLPPLVQVRWIELPPLSEAEARRVLARDAARYFFDAREPQIVAVARDATGRRGARNRARSGRVVAAASPAHLVEALYAAVGGAGGRITTILPAHLVWPGALPISRSGRTLRDRLLLVAGEASLEVLRLAGSRLVSLRRLPLPPGCDPDVLAACVARPGGGVPPPVSVLADEPMGRQVMDLLARVGVEGLPADPRPAWIDPAAVAAVSPALSTALALRPERVYDRARRRARRATVAMAVAALLLFVTAAALDLWGLRRELAAVREHRALIAAEVEQVTAVREVLNLVNGSLATLVALESDAPRWSHVVADVARHLPLDAHLSALRARPDTVLLDGMADDASGVFEALRDAPGVAAIRAETPIRRELRDGQPTVERFALRARLRDAAEAGGVEP
jgi:hypothetical protein